MMNHLHYIKSFTKRIVNLLPDKALCFLAKQGFSNIASRPIEYVGNVTGTCYHIEANSSYPIEVAATRKWNIEAFHEATLSMNLKNCTVLDIGANVGTYSLLFCHAGARQVFAVEPGPLYQRLCNNVSLNGMEKILHPIQLGISSQHHELSWHEDLDNKGNAHLLSTDYKDFNNTTLNEKRTIVRCETLDFLSQHKIKRQIDFMKIDVEGMELDVILSGIKTIKKDNPLIIAETHPANNMANEEISLLMKQLHYEPLSALPLNPALYKWSNLPTDTVFVPCYTKSITEQRIALLS